MPDPLDSMDFDESPAPETPQITTTQPETVPESDGPAQTPAEQPSEPAAEMPASPEPAAPVQSEPQAGAPAEEAPPVEARTQGVIPQPTGPVSDEIDREFSDAIAAVRADELLSDGEKRARLAELRSQQYRHQRDLARDIREQQDDAWRSAEQQHGLTRAQMEPLWRKVQHDLTVRGYRGDALHGAATFAFEQEVAKLRAKPPAAAAKAPATPRRATIQPTPGAVAPPVPSAHRPPPPAKDPLNEFARSVTADDLATL